MEGSEIDLVDNYTYLGTVLDDKLSFQANADAISKKRYEDAEKLILKEMKKILLPDSTKDAAHLEVPEGRGRSSSSGSKRGRSAEPGKEDDSPKSGVPMSKKSNKEDKQRPRIFDNPNIDWFGPPWAKR